MPRGMPFNDFQKVQNIVNDCNAKFVRVITCMLQVIPNTMSNFIRNSDENGKKTKIDRRKHLTFRDEKKEKLGHKLKKCNESNSKAQNEAVHTRVSRQTVLRDSFSKRGCITK